MTRDQVRFSRQCVQSSYWCYSTIGFMSLLIAGCASYSEKTNEMRAEYARGAYDKALDSLKESGIAERSADRLLWRLEAASIYDRKGDLAKSKSLLLEADSIADELYTTSVSKTAQSFLVSDSSQDYVGEDYERVAIHTLLAHQLIGSGKLDDARIEARKIGTKLAEINQKYDEKNRNKYGEDAHARYLAGLIYDAKGEWDNAIIEYAKAVELYEGEFKSYVVPAKVPSGLIRAYYRVLAVRNRDDRIKSLRERYGDLLLESPEDAKSKRWGEGEIAVIHEFSRITPKTKGEFFFGSGRQLVRFSFPLLKPRPMTAGLTGIQVEGRGFTQADNTAYLDQIAHDTLESRRFRMTAKQAGRLLLKGQINDQAHQKFGPLGGLLANVATSVTETADTRSWSLLPQGFFISRVRLPKGDYEVTVKTNNKVSEIKKISVLPGKVVLLRSWD
jgi:uncharacterized protein